MSFISDLLTYGFLQKAMVTAIVVGIIAGVIGCFIILKGMALMGDAISHAILPGVALSYIFGINYFIGAVATGLLVTYLINQVSYKTKLKNDVSVGVIFSAFFALGILLLLKAQTAVDLTQILFGNVLTIKDTDMYITFGVGIVVLILIIIFYKEFLITSFDPEMAKVYGINVNLFNSLLMVLLTLVTVASLQTVGVILVVSMLVTPAATAYLLTEKMKVMLVLSAIFGGVSSIIGLYLSFKYNLSSGAIIVLVSFGFFVLAYLFSPQQGILMRKGVVK
ncbi:MAG: metal ABC transporter permease [Erysipelothrix sp.]|nr:metal ABC transporter permease [Erysipelothrix sp.]